MGVVAVLAMRCPETPFFQKTVILTKNHIPGDHCMVSKCFPKNLVLSLDSLGHGNRGWGATLLCMDSLLLSKAQIVSFFGNSVQVNSDQCTKKGDGTATKVQTLFLMHSKLSLGLGWMIWVGFDGSCLVFGIAWLRQWVGCGSRPRRAAEQLS